MNARANESDNTVVKKREREKGSREREEGGQKNKKVEDVVYERHRVVIYIT